MPKGHCAATGKEVCFSGDNEEMCNGRFMQSPKSNGTKNAAEEDIWGGKNFFDFVKNTKRKTTIQPNKRNILRTPSVPTPSLLLRSFRGDPLWKSELRPWIYQWEIHGTCSACKFSFQSTEECQRCMESLKTVHQCCLIEDRSYERIPVSSACQTPASGSTDPPPPLPPPIEPLLHEEDRGEKWEPEFPAEDGSFTARLQELGSTPCKLHCMDHLSRDPDCEFCKKALGPMYRVSMAHGLPITRRP